MLKETEEYYRRNITQKLFFQIINNTVNIKKEKLL